MSDKQDLQTLLEDCLTAAVLTLAQQLEAEQRAKGVQRIGGDYVPEAISLLKNRQPDILQRLLER